MADCDGRVLLQEKHREGLPHDHGAPQNDHSLPRDRDLIALQHFNDGLRGTGGEGRGLSQHDPRDIFLRNAVQVFLRAELSENLLLIDLGRQRSHDKNSVDLRIIVDEIEGLLELLIARVFRELIVLYLQAEIKKALPHPPLIGDVRFLRPDPDDRKRRNLLVMTLAALKAFLLQLLHNQFSP